MWREMEYFSLNNTSPLTHPFSLNILLTMETGSAFLLFIVHDVVQKPNELGVKTDAESSSRYCRGSRSILSANMAADPERCCLQGRPPLGEAVGCPAVLPKRERRKWKVG